MPSLRLCRISSLRGWQDTRWRARPVVPRRPSLSEQTHWKEVLVWLVSPTLAIHWWTACAVLEC